MNFHHVGTIEAASRETPAIKLWRRPRLNGSARAIVLSLLGAAVAVLGPAFLDAHGWGMSRQPDDVVFDTAIAASFAITCSLAMTHRLLAFPLLQPAWVFVR